MMNIYIIFEPESYDYRDQIPTCRKIGLGQVVQHFRHYILLCKTTVIFNCNPMQNIFTRQLLWAKYSKWIVILQEFDLEFECTKSKKYLVFVELICDLPSTKTRNVVKDSLPDESLFLINSDDIWYEEIIIYLQTQTFQPNLSSTDHRRIRYQARQYIILGDTLYPHGIDSIFDNVSLMMKPRKI
jgi:hypothetical protein